MSDTYTDMETGEFTCAKTSECILLHNAEAKLKAVELENKEIWQCSLKKAGDRLRKAEAKLKNIQSMCGIPDKGDALRAILKEAGECTTMI